MGQRIMLDLSAIRPAGISSKGVISTGAFGIGDNIDTGFLDVYRWTAEHLENGDIGSLFKSMWKRLKHKEMKMACIFLESKVILLLGILHII